MRFFKSFWKRREWTSALRRPFVIEKRHRFAYVQRLARPALRPIAHPRRARLTIAALKIARAA